MTDACCRLCPHRPPAEGSGGRSAHGFCFVIDAVQWFAHCRTSSDRRSPLRRDRGLNPFHQFNRSHKKLIRAFRKDTILPRVTKLAIVGPPWQLKAAPQGTKTSKFETVNGTDLLLVRLKSSQSEGAEWIWIPRILAVRKASSGAPTWSLQTPAYFQNGVMVECGFREFCFL